MQRLDGLRLVFYNCSLNGVVGNAGAFYKSLSRSRLFLRLGICLKSRHLGQYLLDIEILLRLSGPLLGWALSGGFLLYLLQQTLKPWKNYYHGNAY